MSFSLLLRAPDKELKGRIKHFLEGMGLLRGAWTSKRQPTIKNNIFQAYKGKKKVNAHPNTQKNADCGVILVVVSDGNFPGRAFP